MALNLHLTHNLKTLNDLKYHFSLTRLVKRKSDDTLLAAGAVGKQVIQYTACEEAK